MGDFLSPSETSSASYDQRVATAGDQASVAQSGGAVGSGGSFVVGQGARYSESGSLLADTANVGNINAGTGATVTVGGKDGPVADLTGNCTQASEHQVKAFSDTLTREQDALAGLAADTKKNNAFAWIAAAAIAALVLPVLLKRT